ncbi:unnamed protein product [Protopolystoma xenopodis]|uniref:Deacetylase sirtuin-type domain-containing protein n=1 Tax=Protopolystoma xenopodis TaxID=117903 RepID=A0A3S5AX43_9PLAT|nr:unnamed protein product [Protopolystoma xenopodis]
MSQSVPKCPMCHSGDCETDKNIRLNYLDQDVSGACGERLLVNRANGVLKPDIVFFGENLPEQFHDSIAADRTSTDLVLVMGSSLKLARSIPSLYCAAKPQNISCPTNNLTPKMPPDF